MAWFGVLYSMACCHVLILLQQSFASPIIEAYKPKRSSVQSKMKLNAKAVDLRKMLKTLERRIDDASVRQKIMDAQIRAPFAFKKQRMAAALEVMNLKTPSIIYNDSKIVSGSGILLQIFEDGTVNGTMDSTSPYARLTLESIGSGGVCRIKGTKSQRYLVFKKNGRVMAEPAPPTFESIFKSRKSTRLDSIESVPYTWFLGFRHNFKMKKGPRVKLRHKGSQFAVIAQMG